MSMKNIVFNGQEGVEATFDDIGSIETFSVLGCNLYIERTAGKVYRGNIGLNNCTILDLVFTTHVHEDGSESLVVDLLKQGE